MSPPDDTISVRDTARRLHVHENTVRNWVKSGILVGDRLPGSGWLRFRVSDVDRLKDDIEAGRLARARQESAAITRRELDLLITVARMYLDVFAGPVIPASPSQARLYQDVTSIVARYAGKPGAAS